MKTKNILSAILIIFSLNTYGQKKKSELKFDQKLEILIFVPGKISLFTNLYKFSEIDKFFISIYCSFVIFFKYYLKGI